MSHVWYVTPPDGDCMLVLWCLQTAMARLPDNNQVGRFWEDQAVAAERFVLTPHTWSIVIAVIAVLFTIWVVRKGVSQPARDLLPPAFELDEQTHRRALWLVIGGLVLFFVPGFLGDFNIYDDPGNIWRDPVVRELNWENLNKVVLQNHKRVNQEWMFLSLMLSYAAFGRNYAGFFLTNLMMLPILLLLVHRFAALLTRSRTIALVTLLFFGFSPILAELVCWMLERGHYFGLIFALGSCVLYLQYLDVRDEPGSRRWRYLGGAVLSYIACQFGKPIFIYVPVWLVLFDLLRERRDYGRAVLEKIPLVFAIGLFLFKLIDDNHRVRREYIGGSISNTIALDANQFLEYFRASFYPLQTGIRTPWNAPANWLHVTGIPDILVHGFSPLASLVILLCLFIIGLVLAFRFRWPWLLLTGVAGIVSFAPVANVPVHTVVTAYRYTHSTNVLASIALAAATVQLLSAGSPLTGWRRWLPLVGATAWLTLGVYHSNANRSAWSSSASLWTRSAWVLYPNDGWSAYYAGKSLAIEGRHWETLPLYHRALELVPVNREVLRRIGDSHYRLGHDELAAEYYERFFRVQRHRIDRKYARRLEKLGLAELVPKMLRTKDEDED